MQPERRTAGVAWSVLLGGAVVVIVIAALLARGSLFGIGVDAIHNPSRLPDRISTCGREYRDTGTIVTRSAADAGGPVVLIDPAPFAGCPPPTADGIGPCNASAGPACATVVYVRIGVDAYRAYELLGGP
jgi:hypothetical protein